MKKTMKSIGFVVIILLIINLVFNRSDYNTLDAIRSKNEYYNNFDYLFTVETKGMIFDLVIVDNRFTIVTLKSIGANLNQLYSISSFYSYPIEQHIYFFNKYQEYDWNHSSKLSLGKYKWCIVSKEFNIQNENLDCFDFEYNDLKYCLCFEIENNSDY